jgi:hypothetical protein
VHVELNREPPEDPFPDTSLPPYGGAYVGPIDYHLNLAPGVVMRNVHHYGFTRSTPPPGLGSNRVHRFGSRVDFDLSLDGGTNFTRFSAPADARVRVVRDRDEGTNRMHVQTEMIQLGLQSIPQLPGVIIRKDPARGAPGETTISNTPAGPRIGSYFDIPIQLSLDGGASPRPSGTASRSRPWMSSAC